MNDSSSLETQYNREEEALRAGSERKEPCRKLVLEKSAKTSDWSRKRADINMGAPFSISLVLLFASGFHPSPKFLKWRVFIFWGPADQAHWILANATTKTVRLLIFCITITWSIHLPPWFEAHISTCSLDIFQYLNCTNTSSFKMLSFCLRRLEQMMHNRIKYGEKHRNGWILVFVCWEVVSLIDASLHCIVCCLSRAVRPRFISMAFSDQS